MVNKKGFVCVVVLAICTLSCQAIIAVQATPTPAAELAPIPTDTQAPTATRLSEPTNAVAQVTPSVEIDHTPVIQSVELRSETSAGKMTVYQDIFYKDTNADVYFADYEIKSATTGNLSIKDGEVEDSSARTAERRKIHRGLELRE